LLVHTTPHGERSGCGLPAVRHLPARPSCGSRAAPWR